MNPVRLILIGLTLLTIGVQPARGQREQGVATVHAIGSSSARGGDMSTIRQRAIEQSLETAVAATLLDTIPQERLTANFMAVGTTILSRPDQFVRDYKVLTESTQGNTFRVLVQANVSLERLTSALSGAGIAWGQRSELRVLLCLAEKKISDLDYQYWWGSQAPGEALLSSDTVGKQLQNNGVAVVLADAKTHGTLGYPVDLSTDQAVNLAQRLNANVVIVGRARAEEIPNTMGSSLRSFRGTIEMKALLADTGEQLAHIANNRMLTSDDLYQGGKEALLSVALQAGDSLARELKKAWMGQGSRSTAVEVVVEGTGGNIASFVQLRSELGTISGVDSVQLKEMMTNSAVLTVAYQGSARALAEDLLLKSFGTFGINVVETGNRYIRLQLVPK